jgi:hypothetical protein
MRRGGGRAPRPRPADHRVGRRRREAGVGRAAHELQALVDHGRGGSSDAISCSVPIERLQYREAEIVEALRQTKHAIERTAPVSAPGDYSWG